MQNIKCSVGSCMYNSHEKNQCTLKGIQVRPCDSSKSGTPEDETCCGSYKVAK